MVHKVLEGSGKKVILLGNEAIVRGALESGVGFTASYPGTPSSEIGDTFSEIAKDAGIYFEWSVNEKVAAEAAAGAAFSGLNAMTFFKHFGINVACDSIFSFPYFGLEGTMVLVCADDPNGWSSGQNEEDSRRIIQTSHIPYLEPSTPQECKDFVKLAFELSSKFKIPIFLRTTTRVNHTKGVVALGKIVKGKTRGFFKKGRHLNNMPPKVIQMHEMLHEKLAELEKVSENLPINFVLNKCKSKFGVIASGVSFNYVVEALEKMNLKIPVMKVSMWPCPKKKIAEFMKGMKQVIVVEELEPILENEIKRIAQESKLDVNVNGKNVLPSWGEMRIENVLSAISTVFKIKWQMKKPVKLSYPLRDPILCPGCPHRATFWAVKKALGKDAIFGGDIGCYLLGAFEPIEMQDYIIAMGAGIGISHGISKVSDQKIAAIVGDSTFFHACIPGLINMVYNKANAMIVVLDNRITAMTGHQPHPGAGFTGMHDASKEISIAEIAKACGAEVVTVNPFNLKQITDAVKEMSAKPGVKVIIARQPCRLVFMREAKKQQTRVPVYQIDQEKCKKCNLCIEYGCPAIHVELDGKKPKKYYIDESFCWGCAVCPQVCPFNAIQPKKIEGE